MKTIRSFIAIPLAEEVSVAAGRLIRRLAHDGDGIKWVPPDNLHLTLKFLGDVDNTEVPDVCRVIRRVCDHIAPFELCFQGTGGFPNLDRPRVLYVGINDSSGRLVQLVNQLDVELADLRFKRESRDYTPHLTLGRVNRRSRHAPPEVIARIEGEQSVDLGTMQADAVHLVASFLDKQGPSYQTMDRVPLAG